MGQGGVLCWWRRGADVHAAEHMEKSLLFLEFNYGTIEDKLHFHVCPQKGKTDEAVKLSKYLFRQALVEGVS